MHISSSFHQYDVSRRPVINSLILQPFLQEWAAFLSSYALINSRRRHHMENNLFCFVLLGNVHHYWGNQSDGKLN